LFNAQLERIERLLNITKKEEKEESAKGELPFKKTGAFAPVISPWHHSDGEVAPL